MDHGPNVKSERDGAFVFRERIGIMLFGIYSLIYAGFVFINVIDPEIMSIQVAFGVNLAIVYGFSLIIIAIIMGLVYNALCSNAEKKTTMKGDDK